MEPIGQKSGVSFQGHPLNSEGNDVEKRVRSFIDRNGFPVVAINVISGPNLDLQGHHQQSAKRVELILSEHITEKEKYRLTQGLDHDALIGIEAENMSSVIVEGSFSDNLAQHARSLQKRIVSALDYDIEMKTALGGREEVFKTQLVPVGFFRGWINTSGALDLLVATKDKDLQRRILDFSRAMDTYARIVRVGLRKAYRSSLFSEVQGGVQAH